MDVPHDRAVEPPEMRWDGWGDPDRATELPRAVRALLPLLLGRLHRPVSAPDIDEVTVDASRLTADDLTVLSAIVGESNTLLDPQLRLRRAAGRSTPDLLRRREPHQRVPDAVVRPAGHGEVSELLGAAAQRGIAVVPFGGGTSV